MYPKNILLCLLLSRVTSSVLVVDFSSASSVAPGSPLSSAILTNGHWSRLPQRFVLCFSTRLSKIDGKSPFVLYGENNKPWLAFSLWSQGPEVALWAEVQASWTEFHTEAETGGPWTHAWLKVCADVDTGDGKMLVSFNGRPALSRNVEKLKTNKTQDLTGKLVLGLDNASWVNPSTPQFIGSVSEINIFSINKTISLTKLSNITHSQGDILSWKDIRFVLNGNGVSLEEVDIGNANDIHQIVLPFTSEWPEGEDYCRRLGHGRMTGIEDYQELVYTARLLKEQRESCLFLWLPVIMDSEEGGFMNIYSGSLELYLPWGPQQPDGESSQNAVALDLGDLAYYDYPAANSLCISCTVNTNTLFMFRGLCKNSYMGKKKNLIYNIIS